MLFMGNLQETSIEPIINGKNVIISAGTGSGKTEAAIAPIISKYWKDTIINNNLFLIYISPTKALINDLEKRLTNPLSTLHLNIGVRHGDRDDLKNRRQIHILLTTPESLEVLLLRKEKKLNSVKSVIIDEVHLFYNTQRGLQFSILINRLEKIVNHTIQILALSATIGNLEYLKTFLSGDNNNYIYLSFTTTRKIDLFIKNTESKIDLLSLLNKIFNGEPVKVLLFANSRKECDNITTIIKEDKRLSDIVLTHYSSLSTEVRIETEKKFNSLKSAICVATSTLELGIDIGDIELVILFGSPPGISSFLQRIGRGNRRSNTTNVLCIIPWYNKNIFVDSLRYVNYYTMANKGEMFSHEPYELFGAFAQQALSIIASENGAFTRVQDLFENMNNNNYLTRDLLESILAELRNKEFLEKHGFQNRYCRNENLDKLIDTRLIYGNFPSNTKSINLYHGSKLLGEIPSVNILRLYKSATIIFNGQYWNVMKIDNNGIHLNQGNPSKNCSNITYGGSKPEISPEEINRIWLLIFSDDVQKNLFNKELNKEIFTGLNKIKNVCKKEDIPYTSSLDGNVYFTFAGYIVNLAICLYLSINDYKINDYSIKTGRNINWKLIPDNIDEFINYYDMLYEESLNQSIYQKLLPLDLQKREYIQSFIKNKEINLILKRLKHGTPKEITSELAEYFIYKE
jgi:ATP-dependent helicase Lhr and Lhr-like helicase